MSQQISDEEAKLFLKRSMPNKDYLYIFVPFLGNDRLMVSGNDHPTVSLQLLVHPHDPFPGNVGAGEGMVLKDRPDA